MNYEVGEKGRGGGGGENQHQLFPLPMLQGRQRVVCASSVSPIKIKLITKGKQAQSRENSDMGVGSDSCTESKVTDGKKETSEI